jgi:hypothetical protein
MNYNVSANTASATTIAGHHGPVPFSLPSRNRYMWGAALPSSPVTLSKKNLALPISSMKKSLKAELSIPPFSPKSSKVPDLEKASFTEASSSCFSIGVETPTSTPEAAKPVLEDCYATTSVLDAENLLANIRRARAELTMRDAQLVKDIQQNLQNAALDQMVGGCLLEAQESIHHANHLKQERDMVAVAMNVLDFHILSMESVLEDAKLKQASMVDCSEHQFFAQELKDQLRVGY